MKKTLMASLAALALSAGMASAATVNYVVNGSFEERIDNDGTRNVDWDRMITSRNWNTYTGGIPGWQVGAGRLELQANSHRGWTSQDGYFHAELDSHYDQNSNSMIYQDIALQAGQYELSFFYQPRVRVPASSNGIAYSILGSNSVSGSVTGPDGIYQYNTWNEVTQRFTLDSDETVRLVFSATGRSDTLGGYIDNVSIAPVPIPAAGMMLLSVLGGLVAMRRRHKA
ncbi:MAG: VPLPA-CTERM sorting domain-containing protein [Pseudomonadota bacterium]